MAQILSYKRDPLVRVEADGTTTDWWDRDKNVSELLSTAPVRLAAGDVDLRQYCTDSNQYQLSACAGNATADSVEIVSSIEEWLRAEVEGRPVKPVPQLSRLFVYAMARTLDGSLSADEGTYIRSCFEVLSRFGIPEETAWPYDEAKVFVSPSILSQRAALGHKIHSYYRIKSSGQDRLDEIVSALRAMKPVVFGTLIDHAYMDFNGQTVVDRPKGSTAGGHAQIIVGYIDGKFLVKNSWGKGWRDGGFVFFTPEYMTWDETWDLWVPTLGFS